MYYVLSHYIGIPACVSTCLDFYIPTFSARDKGTRWKRLGAIGCLTCYCMAFISVAFM